RLGELTEGCRRTVRDRPQKAVALAQRVRFEAVLAGETGACLLRRVGARPALLASPGRALGRQAGGDHGQAARRHVDTHLRRLDALAAEPVQAERRQLALGLAAGDRRQLLAADLD